MLVALLEDHLLRYREHVDRALARGALGLDARWESRIPDHERQRVGALLRGSHRVDEPAIRAWTRRYPNLRLLSLAFTGHDEVDRAACRRAGLAVYYAPGYSTNAVAEMTVLLALAAARKLSWGEHSTRRGTFDEGGVFPGRELAGATVGVVGTGTIGVESAKKFRGLGCGLLGWTRPATSGERRARFEAIGGTYVDDLDEVCRRADVIALHLALTADTRRIIDARRISLMRRTTILVNTARAGLVETSALAAALSAGRIHGAGIDVYDREPVGPADLAVQPLLTLDAIGCNLVLAPHLGFKTGPALDELARVSLQNVRDFEVGITTNALVLPSAGGVRPAEGAVDVEQDIGGA